MTSSTPEWQNGFLVGVGFAIRRSSVVGFRVRHVPKPSSPLSTVFGGAFVMAVGMVVFGPTGPWLLWPTCCVALFSLIGLATLPRTSVDHWLVEALTMSGPVDLYWTKTERDALSLLSSLTVGMERDQ